jgi:excisionase family DNA binding protein
MRNRPALPGALNDRNTVKQVAAYWQCSPRTVYRLIKCGQLSCLNIGVIRITRAQVEACEQAHTLEAEKADKAAEYMRRRLLDRRMLGKR